MATTPSKLAGPRPRPCPLVCAHCGAGCDRDADRCQACGKPVAFFLGPPAPIARAMGLGAIMWAIALIAGCLAIGKVDPVVGVGAFVVAGPAFVRTQVLAYRRRADGRPMRAVATAGDFLHNCGFLMLVGLLAIVLVFVATMLGGMVGAVVGSMVLGGRNRGGDLVPWTAAAGLLTGLAWAAATARALIGKIWKSWE